MRTASFPTLCPHGVLPGSCPDCWDDEDAQRANGDGPHLHADEPPPPIYFLAPMPPAGLPSGLEGTILGDVATMFQQAWGVPGLLAATTGLGVAAAATRGRYWVSLRSGARFPLALYLCPLSPPGTMKTPLVDALQSPLAGLQRQMLADLGPSIQRERMEAAALDKAIKAKTDELASAIGGGKTTAADKLRGEIESLAEKAQLLQVDGRHSIIFGADLTYEAMINRAAGNGGRIAVLSAEGTLLENLAGRTSDGNAKSEFLNSAYDCEEYTRERIGDGSHIIPAPWATLLFCVQPDVMTTLLANDHMRRRGFVQRFLYASIPATGYRPRHDLPPLDAPLLQRWADALAAIWERHGDPIDLGPGAGTDVLAQFERDVIAAKAAAVQDDSDLLTGWLSKLAMTSVRIAAAVQLLESRQASTVGKRAGQAAASFTEAMILHSEYLFTASPQSLAASPRGRVLRWMAHPPETPITPVTLGSGGSGGIGWGVSTRDVWQRFRDQAWCRSADDVRAVLSDLAALGWIDGPHKATSEKGGRPSEQWHLHPRLAHHFTLMTGRTDPC